MIVGTLSETELNTEVMRILVVEDDAALRDGLRTVLERAGHHASVIGDGIEADHLSFPWGSRATIAIAGQRLHLVA